MQINKNQFSTAMVSDFFLSEDQTSYPVEPLWALLGTCAVQEHLSYSIGIFLKKSSVFSIGNVFKLPLSCVN